MIRTLRFGRMGRRAGAVIGVFIAALWMIAGTPAFAAQGPSVTINQAAAQADPTLNSPILFDVVFSAPVTGFTGAGVTLGGLAGVGAVATVSGSGTTYLVSVTGMTTSGNVDAYVVPGAAVDSSNNPSQVSTSSDNTVAFDARPTVTIDQGAAQADPTPSGTVVFDVVFSKPVTGFSANGVTVGGTAGAFVVSVAGNGANYTVSVSGISNTGTVTASVNPSAAVDANNNFSAASTSTDNTVNFVLTPTVTIEQSSNVGQPDPAAFGPIVFDVQFSAPVTGFTSAGVALSGAAGATTATVSGSGADYLVTVSGMTQSGTVIANVLAGSAVNATNVANLASTSVDNTVTLNIAPLTVTVNQANGQIDPTGSPSIYYDVVFSAPVTGFTASDVILGSNAGATTATVTGSGANYQIKVTGMTQTGAVLAVIPPRPDRADGHGDRDIPRRADRSAPCQRARRGTPDRSADGCGGCRW